MDPDDPDGVDEARRSDTFLRLVAIQAQHDRERRIASMTPLEVAGSDLAAIIGIALQYEAGETSFPVTASNSRAMIRLIAERHADVVRLRGA